jgi:hypothetical protein
MERRRRLLLVLLAFGALAGYGSAAFHMGARAHTRHEAFERHVAEVCLDAARAR